MAEHPTVASSGGYDPVHTGHKRHLAVAIFLCQQTNSELLVILTRDDQLLRKKFRYYMPFEERKEVLEWILEGKGVSFQVVENVDHDLSSKESLRFYRPTVFAKGGDSWNEANLPEMAVCRELGIHVLFGVGGFDKPRNSSDAKDIDKEDII